MAKAATLAPQAAVTGVVRAAGWMAVALASFCLVAVSGRAAAKVGLDTVALMFWRSIVAVGLIVLIAGFRNIGQFATDRALLHLVRNSVHYVAQFSWLYALTLIPLAQLFSLEFAAPLWVAVLAPLLIGERLNVMRVIAAVLGFLGVMIVIRPTTVPLSTGSVFALISALGFALSMIATKRLTRSESALTILFYMSLMQILIGFFPAWPTLSVPAPEQWIWITALAIFGLTAHFSLARAFFHADAIVVAPMDFLRLPLIAVIGVLFYAEPFDPWVLAGGAVIVVANFVNLWGERRRA